MRQQGQVWMGGLQTRAPPLAKGMLVCAGRALWERTLETMQTMNPFSSILYDSTVFAS